MAGSNLEMALAEARCAACGQPTTGLGGHKCGQAVSPALAELVRFLEGARKREGLERMETLLEIRRRARAMAARRKERLQ